MIASSVIFQIVWHSSCLLPHCITLDHQRHHKYFLELVTAHILCIFQSSAMAQKLVETMGSECAVTLCQARHVNECILSQHFDLGIISEWSTEDDAACSLIAVLKHKIILIGNHFSQKDIAQAFDLGVIDYFPDPIDYQLLWQRVYYLTRQK